MFTFLIRRFSTVLPQVIKINELPKQISQKIEKNVLPKKKISLKTIGKNELSAIDVPKTYFRKKHFMCKDFIISDQATNVMYETLQIEKSDLLIGINFANIRLHEKILECTENKLIVCGINNYEEYTRLYPERFFPSSYYLQEVLNYLGMGHVIFEETILNGGSKYLSKSYLDNRNVKIFGVVMAQNVFYRLLSLYFKKISLFEHCSPTLYFYMPAEFNVPYRTKRKNIGAYLLNELMNVTHVTNIPISWLHYKNNKETEMCLMKISLNEEIINEIKGKNLSLFSCFLSYQYKFVHKTFLMASVLRYCKNEEINFIKNGFKVFDTIGEANITSLMQIFNQILENDELKSSELYLFYEEEMRLYKSPKIMEILAEREKNCI